MEIGRPHTVIEIAPVEEPVPSEEREVDEEKTKAPEVEEPVPAGSN